MSSNGKYQFSEPNSIATLPRPFNQQYGSIRGNPVHSLTGSRKRKRNEVVTAIDGESIGLYGVNNPRLITSYPIPPQSYNTCAPCCAVLQSKRSPARSRYTYASLRIDKQNRLVGFTEDVVTSSGQVASESPTKHEVTIPAREGHVVHLDALDGSQESHESSEPSILSLTSAGLLEIRTQDLKVIQSSLRLSTAKETLKVQYTTSQSAATARKGLLKDRQDVLAMLDPTSVDAKRNDVGSDILLIVADVRQAGEEESAAVSKVFLVECRRPGSSAAKGSRLHLLETLSLPPTTPQPTSPSASPTLSSGYELDPSSGNLCILKQNQVAIIKLALKASILRLIPIHSHGESEMQVLSKNALLLVASGACYIYETKFGSLQAVRSLISSSASSSKKKRKRDAAASAQITCKLISWHGKSRTLVVLVGHDLVTTSISTSDARGRHPQSRLIDAFGKSIGTAAESSHTPSEDSTAFQELLQCKKAKAFEDLFFERIEAVEDSDPVKPYYVQRMAIAALAVMFDWNNHYLRSAQQLQETPSISFVLMSVNALEWLAQFDLLTPANIQTALYKHRPLPQGQLPQVRASDLVGVLARSDPSLKHLAMLTTTSTLSLEGWVESLRHFLGSFGVHDSAARPKHLTNGVSRHEQTTSGDQEDTLEPEEEEETSQANVDLSLAFSLLDPTHAQLRGQALRTILSRLGLCYASSSLITVFRTLLPRDHVILLINLLRIELTSSGWTGRTLDFYPVHEGGVDPADEAIHVIGKLLNCCIDSLGVGGWLGTSMDLDDLNSTGENEDADVQTVVELRQAATAALETAQESAFFTNFLNDYLRFAYKAFAGWDSRGPPNDLFLAGHAGSEANMLPLGSQMLDPISNVKVNAGGEVTQRSRREIAQKESRRVGRYEFERIRI